jgi:hypothetical protein
MLKKTFIHLHNSCSIHIEFEIFVSCRSFSVNACEEAARFVALCSEVEFLIEVRTRECALYQ